MSENFTECLNYIIAADGKYVGRLVNQPNCIVQADSLEELEREAKISLRVMVDLFNQALEQPLKLKDVSRRKFHKTRTLHNDCIQEKIELLEWVKLTFDSPSFGVLECGIIDNKIAELKKQIKN